MMKWFNSEELNPVLLWFRKPQQETDYRNQPDPHFRYYVLCAVVLFLCMTAIQVATMSRTVVLWGSYGATLVSLLVFLYLCWLDGFCPHQASSSATPVGGGNTGDFETGPCADQVVTNSRWIRLSVFLISVDMDSEIPLEDITVPSVLHNRTIPLPLSSEASPLDDSDIDSVPSYLYSSVLSLATISVFLRVGFLLKLALMLTVTTFHLALYCGLQMVPGYYSRKHDGFEEMPHQLKMALLLTVIMILLHVLDRQIEFTSRTDFLWKAKLKVEQEEVETMRGINKILLENILPAHVAEHFLDTRNTQGGDLHKYVDSNKIDWELNLLFLIASQTTVVIMIGYLIKTFSIFFPLNSLTRIKQRLLASLVMAKINGELVEYYSMVAQITDVQYVLHRRHEQYRIDTQIPAILGLACPLSLILWQYGSGSSTLLEFIFGCKQAARAQCCGVSGVRHCTYDHFGSN
ncbi:hypothetical protein C0J52_00336 [Blattella germanica]|nr:hypothetical protein C0J52_00336 [Blattella germanica]